MKYTTNNITFNINSHNNTSVFEGLRHVDIVVPQVPKFYVEQSDIWVDNPNHPDYAKAVQVYYHERTLAAQDISLLLAVEKDMDIISQRRQLPKYKLRKRSDDKIWLDFIYETLDVNDIYNVINTAFLTENRIYDIFEVLVSSVYRGGVEIINARIKNAINSQIELENIEIFGMTLAHPLDEYNACITSNISWTDWQEFDNNRKAEIIALYRVNRILDNHSQDEVAVEMERKSKK